MANERVLVLAPHTDDGELGCGATISRKIEEGAEIMYVAFSICTKSLPQGWDPQTLAIEVRSATRVLGIKTENLVLFDFDVRRFKECRQDILEELVKINRDFKPELVLAPSPTDIHQDHQVISEEGLRAFKQTSIIGYELPWNNISFNTRCFIKLKERHVLKKIEVLQEYKSQMHRSYLNADFIRSLAITRGVQINAEYAEAFEVIRWIN